MTVYISPLARQKLFIAANEMPSDEISGFGRTVVLPDGKGVVLTDIVLPPQEVGSAHIDFKPEEWQGFLADVISGKYNADGSPGDPLEWRCWWHKHPGDSKPGPSGVDTDSLTWLAKDAGFGWMLGVIISSRASNVYAWLDVAPPNSPWTLTQKDVEVRPYHDEPSEDVVALVKEQMKGIRRKTYGGNNSSSKGGPSRPWDNSPSQLPFRPGGTGQTPMLTTGQGSAHGSQSPRGHEPDYSLVKNMEQRSGGMIAIEYRNGNIMVVPDRGQMRDWISWLSSPASQPEGERQGSRMVNSTTPVFRFPYSVNMPPPVKKPGERPPKAIKKRIQQYMTQKKAEALVDMYTHEPYEWSPGASVKGEEAPRYPIYVDETCDDLLLGFDDEGDPIHDVFDGDEMYVYYDCNVRAVDRRLLEAMAGTAIGSSAGRIAYYRSKYLIDEAVPDKHVEEFVQTLWDGGFMDLDELEENESLLAAAAVAEDLPLTEDESKVEA